MKFFDNQQSSNLNLNLIFNLLILIVYIIICIYILTKKKLFNILDVEKYLFYIIFVMMAIFFFMLLYIFSDLKLINNSFSFYFLGYLGLLVGIVIVVKFILPWIFSYFPNISFIYNTFLGQLILFFLAIGLLTFIFKQFNFAKPTRSPGSVFGLMYNLLFYLPCLLLEIIEFLKQQYGITPASAYIVLAITITIILIHVYYDTLKDEFLYKDAVVLQKEKKYTNNQSVISSIQDLNFINDNIQYDYAVSCMFNINSFPSDIYSSKNQNVSILNLGDQPNILYNPEKNKLVITMNTEPDSHEKDSQTIYEIENIDLQKWNHLVINYNAGTLDIFYNNRLLSSNPMVIPYQRYSNVTIGQNNGIQGEICNSYYFKKSLDKNEINNIYLYTNYLNNL